jgi:hypothetical protein
MVRAQAQAAAAPPNVPLEFQPALTGCDIIMSLPAQGNQLSPMTPPPLLVT